MVMAFVLSNWIDGTAMFSQAQSGTVVNMTKTNVVGVTSATGSQINYLNIDLGALFTIIGRALTWEYSFFYDKDPITGRDAGSDLGMILFVVKMGFTAITVGVLFQMAYLLRQIITG